MLRNSSPNCAASNENMDVVAMFKLSSCRNAREDRSGRSLEVSRRAHAVSAHFIICAGKHRQASWREGRSEGLALSTPVFALADGQATTDNRAKHAPSCGDPPIQLGIRRQHLSNSVGRVHEHQGSTENRSLHNWFAQTARWKCTKGVPTQHRTNMKSACIVGSQRRHDWTEWHGYRPDTLLHSAYQTSLHLV